MVKKIVFLTMFFCVFHIANAQIYVDNEGNVYDQRKSSYNSGRTNTYNKKESSSGFDISKLTVGGSFGLQFGDYTVINISPQVGYNFSKYLTLGAGFGYTYFKEDYSYVDYKQSYLSFNLFGRFYPIENIVLSVQPEISRMWQTVEERGTKYSESKFVPSLLLGGGIRYSGLLAMIQYDVIQDKNTPYGDRLFYTVGYYFNF